MKFYDHKKETWRIHAICRGSDTSKFFPEHGTDINEFKAIRALCNTCPVKVECLESALNQDMDIYGFFGGKSPRERRAMRAEAHWNNHPVGAACALHDYEPKKALDVECEDEEELA